MNLFLIELAGKLHWLRELHFAITTVHYVPVKSILLASVCDWLSALLIVNFNYTLVVHSVVHGSQGD